MKKFSVIVFILLFFISCKRKVTIDTNKQNTESEECVENCENKNNPETTNEPNEREPEPPDHDGSNDNSHDHDHEHHH
jgi:hypothetical protein